MIKCCFTFKPKIYQSKLDNRSTLLWKHQKGGEESPDILRCKSETKAMDNFHRFNGDIGTGKAPQRQYYPDNTSGEKWKVCRCLFALSAD